METKGTDTNGGTSKASGQNKAKLRKILYIICLVLLAIVAFRKWSRKTEAGTAEIIGGADKPTVAVLLPDAEEAGTAAQAVESAGPEAPPPVTPVLADSPEQTEAAPPDDASAPLPPPGWCGLNGGPPLLEEITEDTPTPSLPVTGAYTSKEDVALYIHLYGKLPGNFITKAEAKKLGWGDRYGSVDDAAPGKSIGGDRFGNREGLLPKKTGRTYTECDIDTRGKKSRGAKRIVLSNDGLVYYTGDHYETFELLYGSE